MSYDVIWEGYQPDLALQRQLTERLARLGRMFHQICYNEDEHKLSCVVLDENVSGNLFLSNSFDRSIGQQFPGLMEQSEAMFAKTNKPKPTLEEREQSHRRGFFQIESAHLIGSQFYLPTDSSDILDNAGHMAYQMSSVGFIFLNNPIGERSQAVRNNQICEILPAPVRQQSDYRFVRDADTVLYNSSVSFRHLSNKPLRLLLDYVKSISSPNHAMSRILSTTNCWVQQSLTNPPIMSIYWLTFLNKQLGLERILSSMEIGI